MQDKIENLKVGDKVAYMKYHEIALMYTGRSGEIIAIHDDATVSIKDSKFGTIFNVPVGNILKHLYMYH